MGFIEFLGWLTFIFFVVPVAIAVLVFVGSMIAVGVASRDGGGVDGGRPVHSAGGELIPQPRARRSRPWFHRRHETDDERCRMSKAELLSVALAILYMVGMYLWSSR